MSGDNQKLICFPPFRLDCPEHRLYRGDELIPLRPKSFELLQYLALRPARLVTKEELLEAVWPDTTTTDTVLKVCIREIREALGDDAAQSRYIETAHRRGYRFIANIEEPGRPQNVSRSTSPLTLVGREVEIERLNSLLAGTLSGARQVVFVKGEPGIGKTTLVQSWLDQITVNSNVLVAHGQCLEQYGSSEAYLPMLEAVSRLCRGPKYEAVIAVLRRHAPTWLAQIPWLIPETERHVQSETLGATRERMLREIAEAVEAITENSPLLLVLEDLHWSDYSTLDLISYLARRKESARLMVIGTYRPADISARHPLNALKQELRAHQQCEELPLKLLDEKAVAAHLAARFPDNRFPSDLPHSLHQRTEGNPMFINHLVDFFVSNGLIVAVDGSWVLTQPLSEVEATLPDNIRQIIEKQAAGLSEQEQQILESASIAGLEFSTAMVAASLNKDNFEVEEVCEKLARRHLFIRFADGVESAAGEISARYGFIHALYQNAFYERVPIARGAYLHKKIAEHLEATSEDRSGSLAAELALHFEKARDFTRAVANLHDAAQNANRRSANREAETLSRRGLELVTKLTPGPERLQVELLLQTCLATSLSATYGYGAAEVEQAYSRARELCDESSSDLQLAPVLWGLWRFYLIRSDLHVARELAQQLFDLARSEQNDALLIGAHSALGTTYDNLGDFEAANKHFEQGVSLYEPSERNTYLRLYGSDPGVTLRSFNAWALWSLGDADLALNIAREAVTLAEELRHPETLCFALFFTAWVHQLRREPHDTLNYAQATIEIAEKNGLAQWTAFGASLHGWAAAEQGRITEGIAEMRKTLETYNAIGSEISRPHFLGLLAEALMKERRLDEALLRLSEALAVVENTGQRYYESELQRLKGELFMHTGDRNRARECFQISLEIARRQKARSFEQRAEASLSLFLDQRSRRDL